MELKFVLYKVLCDMPGCNNFADYKIVRNGEQFQNLKFCSSCLLELHKCTGKIIPKKSKKANK